MGCCIVAMRIAHLDCPVYTPFWGGQCANLFTAGANVGKTLKNYFVISDCLSKYLFFSALDHCMMIPVEMSHVFSFFLCNDIKNEE